MQCPGLVLPRVLEALDSLLAGGGAGSGCSAPSWRRLLQSALTQLSQALALDALDAASKGELSGRTAALLRAALAPSTLHRPAGGALAPQLIEGLHLALGDLYDDAVQVRALHCNSRLKD